MKSYKVYLFYYLIWYDGVSRKEGGFYEMEISQS